MNVGKARKHATLLQVVLRGSEKSALPPVVGLDTEQVPGDSLLQGSLLLAEDETVAVAVEAVEEAAMVVEVGEEDVASKAIYRDLTILILR